MHGESRSRSVGVGGADGEGHHDILSAGLIADRGQNRKLIGYGDGDSDSLTILVGAIVGRKFGCIYAVFAVGGRPVKRSGTVAVVGESHLGRQASRGHGKCKNIAVGINCANREGQIDALANRLIANRGQDRRAVDVYNLDRYQFAVGIGFIVGGDEQSRIRAVVVVSGRPVEVARAVAIVREDGGRRQVGVGHRKCNRACFGVSGRYAESQGNHFAGRLRTDFAQDWWLIAADVG